MLTMQNQVVLRASSTLVLLRHGSSVANEGLSFGGWDDVSLSEKGVEQAQSAGLTLKRMGLRFDVGFTSVLRRATWTLWHCLSTLDQTWVPMIPDWRLNERHFGALQGMKKTEAERLYGKDQVESWRYGFRIRPPQLEHGDRRDSFSDARYKGLSRGQVPLGESLHDTQLRVNGCWNELIVPALRQRQNVLLVAHGNSIRALLMKIEGITEEKISLINVNNGVPLVYTSNGSSNFVSLEVS